MTPPRMISSSPSPAFKERNRILKGAAARRCPSHSRTMSTTPPGLVYNRGGVDGAQDLAAGGEQRSKVSHALKDGMSRPAVSTHLL